MTAASIWLVVAGAVLGLVLVGAFGFTVGRVQERCCARCRYPTAGLPVAICPECGSELAGRGTREPGARLILRPPVDIAVFCRLLLLVVPALYVLTVEIAYSPVVIRRASVVATAYSGRLHLAVAGRGKGSVVHGHVPGTPRSSTVAVLAGPERTVRLRVRDAAVRATYDAPGYSRVRTADALTLEDVTAWMEAAGFDREQARFDVQVAAVHQLIRNIVVGGESLDQSKTVLAGLTLSRATTSTYRRPRVWALLLIVVPTFGGGWWLVRDANRRFGPRARPA